MELPELSAQEAAIEKAIALLKKMEKLDGYETDIYAMGDAANAWATVAAAITEHNRQVVSINVAAAATEFIKTPKPEHYSALSDAVEEFLAT